MPGRTRDRGQAVVELAIVLPIVAMLVLAILQVVIVVRHQIQLELAAREAARAASVSAQPAAAARRAVTLGGALGTAEVEVHVRADRVTVTVRRADPTSVPIVGAAIGDVELSASVTMARDPP